MEQEKLEHFKSLFNNILLTQGLEDGNWEDFEKHRAPKGDELDLAARDRDQELDLKLKGRKSFFVKKIENSIQYEVTEKGIKIIVAMLALFTQQVPATLSVINSKDSENQITQLSQMDQYLFLIRKQCEQIRNLQNIKIAA